MPKIEVVPAGGEVVIGVTEPGTLRVIGLFGNGANDIAMPADEIQTHITSSGSATKFTAPNVANGPIKYLVKWEREVNSGAMLQNSTAVSSDLVKLTLFCAMGDPCKDSLRPCYVVIPRFAADPSMTISLDAETQEIDFNGNLNVD